MNTESLDSPKMKAVMRRLKKILALSESSSPGEAAAAIQQAQSLMAKYNITEEGIAMSEITELGVNAKTVELERWEKVKDISPTPTMLGKYVQDVTKGRDTWAYKPTMASKSSDAFGNIGYAMGQSAELNRGVDQGKSNLAIAMASST